MLLEKWLLMVQATAVGPLGGGPLYMFGDNSFGQLGTNNTTTILSPTQVGILSWSKTSVGQSHVIAIRNDNKLFTWGANNLGQLGDGTEVTKSSPVQIGGDNWTSISTEGNTSYAIRSDGLLFAWGNANEGELGINGIISNSKAKSWSVVAIEASSTVAIRSDGLLFSWGTNTNGTLGINTNTNRSSATQVGTSSWTTVATAADTTVGILSDGGLFAWGLGTTGQLGDNTATTKSSPVKIGTGSWTTASVGNIFAAAIDASGLLFVWGANTSGQLGDGTVVSKSSPIQLAAIFSETQEQNYATAKGISITRSWVQVSEGTSHVLALDSNGTLYAWGQNASGQLGTNNLLNASSPVAIGSSSWTLVSSGDAFSVAIRTDGSLFAWGLGTSGQLGTYDIISRSSPTQIGTASWTTANAGLINSSAIDTLGRLFTWGTNAAGQLGINDLISRSSPVQVGTSSWSSVSSGNSFTQAIRTDGALFGWGLATSGQLGQGVVVSRSSPVQITSLSTPTAEQDYATATGVTYTLKSWVDISSGPSHSAAIDTNGTLYTWGLNNIGQLGTNDIVGNSSPTPVGTSSWVAVSVNTSQTFAIRADGGLFVWGVNAAGQLGTFDVLSRSSPTQIGTSSWSSISAGDSHTTAIRSDGALFTWGLNTSGQLGDNTVVTRSSPTQISTTSWTQVYGGASITHAKSSDGSLFAWGLNTSGQLGNGTILSRSSPVQITSLSSPALEQSYATNIGISFTPKSWLQVSSGFSFTVGIDTNYKLYSWGYNNGGQLGIDSIVNQSFPTLISSSSWVAVAAGESHVVALRSDGMIFTWGSNAQGQLGLNGGPSRSSPTQVGTSSWSAVGAASLQTILLRSDNSLFAVGYNTSGQLGDNSIINKSSPVQIGTSSWISVGTGASTTSAIRSDGGLFTWGANTNGNLGINLATVPRSSPVQVGTNSWTSVITGAQNSAMGAILNNGTLWMWGFNQYGQIGDNTIINRSSPVQVGSQSWSSVSANGQYTLGITFGKLFSWGWNNNGQLGIGTSVNRSSPTQIGTSSWNSVTTAYAHAGAILNDSTLYTWGDNTFGNLGRQILVNTSSPVMVQTITDSWSIVSSGTTHAVGIRNDGYLFGWGLNSVGQLGFNTVTGISYPSAVGTSSWTLVNAGALNTSAIRNDGTLWTWGSNSIGQLGTGNTVNRSSPTQVGSGTWSDVSAGGSAVMATASSNKSLFVWGDNTFGQLGRLQLGTLSSPMLVQTISDSWVDASTGYLHSAVIRKDNTLWAWGNNAVGQLGQYDLFSRSAPVQIGYLPSTGYSSLYFNGSSTYLTAPASANYSFGTGDFTVEFWAYANSFSNTNGKTCLDSRPTSTNGSYWICGMSNTGIMSFTTMTTGGVTLNDTTARFNEWVHYAVTRSGTSLRFFVNGNLITSATNSDNISSSGLRIGTNAFSGTATDTYYLGYMSNLRIIKGFAAYTSNFTPSTTPLTTTSQGVTASQVSLLTCQNFSIIDNSTNNVTLTVVSTVYPISFQPFSSPTYTQTSWSQVTAGGSTTGALRSTNQLFMWGLNTSGQVGDSTLTSKSSPIQIGTGSWTNISSGINNTAGVTSTSKLYVWGPGQYGQLGNLTSIAGSSSPTFVKSINESFTQVATGLGATTTGHLLALRNDGALFSAGLNDNGQLGQASTVTRSTLLQVGSSSWSSVNAGFSTSAAIKTDGTLYTWGNNTTGQLGIYDVIARSSPTQVGYNLADGYSSVVFDGSGDYCVLPLNSVFAIGLGDFTIEAWVYPTAANQGYSVIFAGLNYGVSSDWGLYASTNTPFVQFTNTIANRITAASSISQNTWTHIAMSRSSGTARLFINGVQSGSSVNASTWSVDNTLQKGIGGGYTGNAATMYTGYISNLRITREAIYTANFTPSTSPLTTTSQGITSTNVSLLTCQNFPIIDNSTNNLPITINGNTVASPLSPFASPTYTQDSWSAVSTGISTTTAIRADKTLFTWGLNTSGQLGFNDVISRSSPVQIGASASTGYISAGLNGFNSLLQTPTAQSALNPGSSAFTMETWFYANNTTPLQQIYVHSDGTFGLATSVGLFMYIQNGVIYGGYCQTLSVPTITGPSVSANTWNHVALVNDGTTVKLYVNGTAAASTIAAGTVNSPATAYSQIGSFNTSSGVQRRFYGNISNFRLTIGVAVYTGNFTVPTSPLTVTQSSGTNISAITSGQTRLLTCQDYPFVDNSSNSFAITATNVAPVYSNQPFSSSGVTQSSWTAVATGNTTTAALRVDGGIFEWGVNTNGQLGLENAGPSGNITSNWLIARSSPVQVGTTYYSVSPTQIGTNSWNAINSGISHAVGVRTDGSLYTWGINTYGQLGTGDIVTRSSPVQIAAQPVNGYYSEYFSGSVTTVMDTAALQLGTGAFTVEAWVYPTQLGLNGLIVASTTWSLSKDASNNLTFSIGPTPYSYSTTSMSVNTWYHVAVIRDSSGDIRVALNGTLSSVLVNNTTDFSTAGAISSGTPWRGYISNLRIVTGTAVYTTGFSPSTSPLTAISGTQLLTFQGSTLLDNSPNGYNVNPDIGVPTPSTTVIPFTAPTGSWLPLASAGQYQTMAIAADSTLYGWGSVSGVNDLSPTTFLTPYSQKWAQISEGLSSTLAIRNDGTLWFWGPGTNGTSGLNDTINRSYPTQIGVSKWTQVSNGNTSAFAIRSDGALFVWGLNTGGVLGTYDQVARSSPTQIGTSSWTAVSTYLSTTAAIRSDGGLFVWGVNSGGMLGTNDVVTRSSPVQLGSGSWTSVSIGDVFTLALNTNNSLFAWGTNAAGQLGDGTVVNRSSPTQIGTSSWMMISAGSSHSVALNSSGNLFTWGSNANGQLGQNSVVLRSSPTQVGTGVWTYISAGKNQTAAIDTNGYLFGFGINSGQIGDNSIIARSSPVQIGTGTWSRVSTNTSTTVALTANRILFAWGLNNGGQVQPVLTNRSSPVQVATINYSPVQVNAAYSWSSLSTGISHGLAINSNGLLYGWGNYVTGASQQYSWVQIVSSNANMAAIRSDGSLWTWGLNTNGAMGINTAVSQSVPQLVGSSSWTQVSVGFSHMMAIRSDGALFGWGTNAAGQLGDNTVVTKSSPVQIGTSSWSSVSAGNNITSAIRSDGAIFTWATNTNGALGDSTVVTRSSPTQIGTSSWTSVSVGDAVTAIRSDGLLFTWGLGTSGTLAQGDLVSRSSPVQVYAVFSGPEYVSYVTNTSSTASFTQLSASGGLTFTGGIRNDGSLWMWGINTGGAQGKNVATESISVTQLGSSSWSVYSAGFTHSTAISASGSLFAWGLGTSGQLGDNSIITKSSPVQLGTDSWTNISSGNNYSLAIRNDGGLFVWGLGTSGQLGTNSAVTRSSPIQIGTSSWALVSAATTTSYATKSDGTLWAWGLNTNGELGDGTAVSRSSPVQLTTITTQAIENDYATAKGISITSWSQVSDGGSHVAAINSIGELYLWGNNATGALGINDASNMAQPMKISNSSWSMVSAGLNYTAAIRVDGALFVWGTNAQGQLGLNDLVTRSSPIQIGTSSWSSVSSGVTHISAIRSDGGLFAWGFGTSGQLGFNDIISRSSPTQIGTSSWTSVDSGGTHTGAIRTDGGLFTWGLSGNGQVGQNNIVSRSSPTQVGTSSWSIVSAGAAHTVGTTVGGSLFAWGLGTSGQLGTNTAISRSSPTQVGTSSWSVVSAGNSFTTAISNNLMYVWGDNSSGQLTLGDLVARSSPTQVGSGIIPNYSSYFFPGTGNYLTFPTNAAPITTGEFTLEFWLFRPSATTGFILHNGFWQIGQNGGYYVAVNSNNTLGLNASTGTFNTTPNVFTTTSTLSLNTWQHVAITRDSSNNINCYIDGVSAMTPVSYSASLNLASSGFGITTKIGVYIADGAAQPNPYAGYLSNMRLVNSCLYTSTFTPPTSPLTAISGTTFLTLQGPPLLESSTPTSYLTNTITVTGTINPSSSSPFSGAVSYASVTGSKQSNFMHLITTAKKMYGSGTNASFTTGNKKAVTGYSMAAFVPAVNDSFTVVSGAASGAVGMVSAIRNDGTLWVWGGNTNGALGIVSTANRSNPVQIGGSSWTTVSMANSTTLGVQNNTLYGWGLNTSGQLGLTDAISRSSPTQIGTGSWNQVYTGFTASFAKQTNNVIYAFGSNTSGMLGLNLSATTATISSPVVLSTVNTSFTSVGNWASSTMGLLRSTGTLFVWGLNTSGQLGDNTITTKSYAIPINTTTSWASISAGGSTAGAIRSDNLLFVWGANTNGALGQNNVTFRSSPTQVGSYSWRNVSVNNNGAMLANRKDYILYSSGLNTNGLLGLGDVVSRSSPTQIGTGWYVPQEAISTATQIGTASWVQVSAGNNFSQGIQYSTNVLYMWGVSNYAITPAGLNPTNFGYSAQQVGSGNINGAFVGQ